MTKRIVAALDKLNRGTHLKDRWKGARFEWVASLAPTEIGSVAEALGVELFGGERQPVSAGYDVLTPDGKRIEVKVCRRSFSQTNIWSWKQIRHQDPYTHILLVAIEPDNARAFLVPRDDIPVRAVSNLHTRGGDTQLGQIAVRNEILPEWIVKHEIE